MNEFELMLSSSCCENILDKEKPDITCVEENAITMWEMPVATNSPYDLPRIICYLELGTTVAIGQTRITCKADDDSGNNGDCNFLKL